MPFDLKRAFMRAAACTLATTAVATLLSKLETKKPAAALNATSHIVWGKSAFRVDAADLKHTLTGALLNAGAMLAWSTVYELLPEPRSTAARVAKAAGVTAASYITDYYLVPKRVTPGFEERLSSEALAVVYTALGVGLFGASPAASSAA